MCSGKGENNGNISSGPVNTSNASAASDSPLEDPHSGAVNSSASDASDTPLEDMHTQSAQIRAPDLGSSASAG